MNIYLNILKFVDFILLKNLTLYRINEIVYINLNCLLETLSKDCIKVKLSSLKIYVKLLERMALSENNFNTKIVQIFDLFPAYLESLLYLIYDENTQVAEDILIDFNELLNTYITYSFNIPHLEHKTIKIVKFLLNNIEREIILSNLQKSCFKYIGNHVNQNEITSLDILKYPDAVKMYQRQIKHEIQLCNQTDKILNIFDETVSKSFNDIWKYLMEIFQKNCNEDCKFEETLKLLQSILKMIMEIKMELQISNLTNNSYNENIFVFFEEEQFVYMFLYYVNNHLEMCNKELPTELFLNVIVLLPVALFSKNVEIFFYLVTCPFFKRIGCYMILSEINFDLKQNLKKLSNMLTFTENFAFKYACLFIQILSSGLVNVPSDQKAVKSGFLKFMNCCIAESNIGAEKTVSKSKFINYLKYKLLILHVFFATTLLSLAPSRAKLIILKNVYFLV